MLHKLTKVFFTGDPEPNLGHFLVEVVLPVADFSFPDEARSGALGDNLSLLVDVRVLPERVDVDGGQQLLHVDGRLV